jgi:hypothetical protein
VWGREQGASRKGVGWERGGSGEGAGRERGGSGEGFGGVCVRFDEMGALEWERGATFEEHV